MMNEEFKDMYNVYYYTSEKDNEDKIKIYHLNNNEKYDLSLDLIVEQMNFAAKRRLTNEEKLTLSKFIHYKFYRYETVLPDINIIITENVDLNNIEGYIEITNNKDGTYTSDYIIAY